MSSKAPRESQFKVTLDEGAAVSLDTQARALGFHTENAWAASILKTFENIPPHKCWEVLAKVAAYQRPGYRPRK